MRWAMLFLVLFIFSCSSADDPSKNPTEVLRLDAERNFKFNELTEVSLVPSPEGQGKDIEIIYPIANAGGQASIISPFSGVLERYFKEEKPVHAVRIIIKENAADGRLMGTFEITQQEVRKLRSENAYINKFMKDYVKWDEKYAVELNLRKYAESVEDVKIERLFNKTTNITAIEISFKVGRETDPYKAAKSVLENQKTFETLVSDIIRTTFETDKTIDAVSIEAYLLDEDMRWNQSTLIGTYEMDREQFMSILEKWDDLRYKIYEEIEYGPIFLMDYTSDSSVTKMDYNRTTKVYLYYENDFESTKKTLQVIEADAADVISQLFENYDLVENVHVEVKAKLPAREGDISSDGTHIIIPDMLVVDAERYVYEELDTETLNARQTLYNYQTSYAERLAELNIIANMYATPEYFREIEFEPSMDEVTLHIDSCLYLKDTSIGPRIKSIIKQLAQGYDGDLEDEVYKELKKSVKNLVFDIHPPFLETVNYVLEMVYLDTTGNVIDVTELGSLTFEKEDEANYWFQTVDPNELEWVVEVDGDLDIDNDEVLCQT